MASVSIFLLVLLCVLNQGESRTVDLVAIAGNRTVYGGNGLISGQIDENKAEALQRARDGGFKGIPNVSN